mmetsp:Transcript_26036/g.85666  ORF Transcript_26036/g.85666 Transcript_26036/m.85666 type:complete len:144 (+) Transcript_26036:397-828(+)
MLRKAKQKVKELGLEAGRKVAFDYLEAAQLPADCTETFDFIYSFDCFPHCDSHTIFQYLKEIRRALKSEGRAMIHTANITTEPGFKRFAKQKEASVQGFCFTSPDIIRTLVKNAGLEIVKESSVDGNNIYYSRDFLCVLRKSG